MNESMENEGYEEMRKWRMKNEEMRNKDRNEEWEYDWEMRMREWRNEINEEMRNEEMKNG